MLLAPLFLPPGLPSWLPIFTRFPNFPQFLFLFVLFLSLTVPVGLPGYFSAHSQLSGGCSCLWAFVGNGFPFIFLTIILRMVQDRSLYLAGLTSILSTFLSAEVESEAGEVRAPLRVGTGTGLAWFWGRALRRIQMAITMRTVSILLVFSVPVSAAPTLDRRSSSSGL